VNHREFNNYGVRRGWRLNFHKVIHCTPFLFASRFWATFDATGVVAVWSTADELGGNQGYLTFMSGRARQRSWMFVAQRLTRRRLRCSLAGVHGGQGSCRPGSPTLRMLANRQPKLCIEKSLIEPVMPLPVKLRGQHSESFPAIAPMTKNGSAPEMTASGSAVSGE
jgi:hypothetical protein